METNTTAHQFANDPRQDGPDTCSCGAMFYDGYNLQAMKMAHLQAHGVEAPPAPVTIPDNLPSALVAAALRIGLDGLYDDDTRELFGVTEAEVDALEAFVDSLS